MKDIIEQLEDVWGGHSDFSSGGVEYVNFVIRNNLDEIDEANGDLESVKKEYADIMLIIIRELYELGFDPKEVILWRLNTRMRGQTEEIISKYKKLYDSCR